MLFTIYKRKCISRYKLFETHGQQLPLCVHGNVLFWKCGNAWIGLCLCLLGSHPFILKSSCFWCLRLYHREHVHVDVKILCFVHFVEVIRPYSFVISYNVHIICLIFSNYNVTSIMTYAVELQCVLPFSFLNQTGLFDHVCFEAQERWPETSHSDCDIRLYNVYPVISCHPVVYFIGYNGWASWKEGWGG